MSGIYTARVRVAQVTPLMLSIPGDPPGVTVPAVNVSGLTLAEGDQVQMSKKAREFPLVTGRVAS